MVVLLLFNKSASWIIQQMHDETQIKEDLFLQVLCVLLKSKVIVCPEINEEDLEEDLKETDIKMNYTIRVAHDFKKVNDRESFNPREFYSVHFIVVKRSKLI